MKPVVPYLGLHNPLRGTPKFTQFGEETLIGIEVEVENMRDGIILKRDYWQSRDDGSLRNRGIEWVTFPINGEHVPTAVHDLFRNLPEAVDFSERTSVHVHVDYTISTLKEIINTILIYLPIERLMYKFAGNERYNNIFCVPLQETPLPLAISKFLNTGDVVSLIHNWEKYSGMNLLPLTQFGTIEFRHMKGHRDFYYLMTWINLLRRIRVEARNREFEALFSGIKDLNTSSQYEQFLRTIFQEDAKYLISVGNVQEEMESGVAAIKLISPDSQFLKNIRATISSESDMIKKTKLFKRTEPRTVGLRMEFLGEI